MIARECYARNIYMYARYPLHIYIIPLPYNNYLLRFLGEKKSGTDLKRNVNCDVNYRNNSTFNMPVYNSR